MKKCLQVSLLLTILISCKVNDSRETSAKTILMDADYLAKTKTKIEKKDPKLKDAFELLIEQAEANLLEGPFSVTEKEKLPPSGDKHDYASYSRYWWPDPEQRDGLPYIRRDGETNPASQSLKESDRQRIGALGRNTETLGLAYYLPMKKSMLKKQPSYFVYGS